MKTNILYDTELTKPVPVLYKSKANCCGCSACYSICPASAISMIPDEEGFLYPTIDSKKCVHCFKCIDVCAFKPDQKDKGYYQTQNVGLKKVGK
jgi:Formate hydrogenlyase subunit 6/NADH:ubiquinone oxidoreductase 23 kD subunit (chain I)